MLGVLALVMVVVIATLGGFYVYASGASGPQTALQFTVPEGATTSEVAELLEQKGVIRSSFLFRLLARFRDVSTQAGLYELSTNMNLAAVFDELNAGPVPPPSVTFAIPEGLRVDEIANRAAEQLGFTAEGFMKAARSGDFSLPPYLAEGTTSLEGFLFPKTYEFFPNPKPKAVIERMLDQFSTEVEDLPWSNADQFGLTPYQVVVAASLIEREARADEDRGKIARVIYNRLGIGQALEIDATIQYALGENRPITNDDKAIDSPYNTYQHTGLTPTPIAAPGLESIRAALEPTPGDWLYYLVVDPESGRHEFFETYDEFLQALNSR